MISLHRPTHTTVHHADTLPTTLMSTTLCGLAFDLGGPHWVRGYPDDRIRDCPVCVDAWEALRESDAMAGEMDSR